LVYVSYALYPRYAIVDEGVLNEAGSRLQALYDLHSWYEARMDRARLNTELVDLPTERLEEMYFREAGDWSEEARRVMWEHLERRGDRRIGSIEKYCPFCKSRRPIGEATCDCGYDFSTSSTTDAIKREGRKRRERRLAGLVMVAISGGYIVFRWDNFLASAQHNPPLLFGFVGLSFLFGVYMLLTGGTTPDARDVLTGAYWRRRS